VCHVPHTVFQQATTSPGMRVVRRRATGRVMSRLSVSLPLSHPCSPSSLLVVSLGAPFDTRHPSLVYVYLVSKDEVRTPRRLDSASEKYSFAEHDNFFMYT